MLGLAQILVSYLDTTWYTIYDCVPVWLAHTLFQVIRAAKSHNLVADHDLDDTID